MPKSDCSLQKLFTMVTVLLEYIKHMQKLWSVFRTSYHAGIMLDAIRYLLCRHNRRVPTDRSQNISYDVIVVNSLSNYVST